uniref:NADH dehydrogenase subunit 6 n=1 Tax=Telenomus dignus TaxID=1738631 RepID=A0A342I4D6_9HYME|nr:NADH dehydrogenase subunit 6 [Telenomus dignus]
MMLYYKLFLFLMINFILLFNKNFQMSIFIFLIVMMIIPLNYKFLNPMMINLNIIIFTILLMIFFNFINKTNWFSILIFLVMIGGMMILFLYLNSFAINESSSNNKYLMKNLELKMTFLILINLMMNNSFIMNFIMKNILIMNFKLKINLTNEPTTIFIFNKFSSLFLIFMISYLLVTLISITYICMSKKSSMRMMN